MREIIQWVSIVLLWVVTFLNVGATIRTVRLSKRLKRLIEEYQELKANLLAGAKEQVSLENELKIKE